MSNYSRKPLIVPLLATLMVLLIVCNLFFFSQQIKVDLPPKLDVNPSISRDGSSFSGFIDVIMPINITNRSPGVLKNIKIIAMISIVSIENLGFFPDTTIVTISQEIKRVSSNEFIQVILLVKVSSLISILAITDAYLVLDVNVNLDYKLGPLSFPIHFVSRIQDRWEAPFPL